MLTDHSPLIHRTCEACKAEQRREANRKTAARRKAERHAAKATMGLPRCKQCGDLIKGANRLTAPYDTAPMEDERPTTMGAQVLQQYLQAGSVSPTRHGSDDAQTNSRPGEHGSDHQLKQVA